MAHVFIIAASTEQDRVGFTDITRYDFTCSVCLGYITLIKSTGFAQQFQCANSWPPTIKVYHVVMHFDQVRVRRRMQSGSFYTRLF